MITILTRNILPLKNSVVFLLAATTMYNNSLKIIKWLFFQTPPHPPDFTLMCKGYVPVGMVPRTRSEPCRAKYGSVDYSVLLPGPHSLRQLWCPQHTVSAFQQPSHEPSVKTDYMIHESSPIPPHAGGNVGRPQIFSSGLVPCHTYTKTFPSARQPDIDYERLRQKINGYQVTMQPLEI